MTVSHSQLGKRAFCRPAAAQRMVRLLRRNSRSASVRKEEPTLSQLLRLVSQALTLLRLDMCHDAMPRDRLGTLSSLHSLTHLVVRRPALARVSMDLALYV